MQKHFFPIVFAFLLLMAACRRNPNIVGVKGPLPARDMGLTLIHEHVFLDWTGADSIRPDRWDNDAAVRRILPYLRDMQAQGVKTMLECTPNYIGRNPRLPARLADSTGLNIPSPTRGITARRAINMCLHTLTRNRPTNWRRVGLLNLKRASTEPASGRVL